MRFFDVSDKQIFAANVGLYSRLPRCSRAIEAAHS